MRDRYEGRGSCFDVRQVQTFLEQSLANHTLASSRCRRSVVVDFTKTLTRLDCFDFSLAALIVSYDKPGTQSGASKSIRFSHRTSSPNIRRFSSVHSRRLRNEHVSRGNIVSNLENNLHAYRLQSLSRTARADAAVAAMAFGTTPLICTIWLASGSDHAHQHHHAPLRYTHSAL